MGTSETYCKKIVVDHTKVSNEDLIDFPLLIVLEDSVLRGVAYGGARQEGGDIYFVGADGSRLDGEIERYDAATGALRAWVRMPRLSHTEDTEIFLCCGQGGSAGEGSVWDSGYRLVRHSNTGGHEIVPHAEDLNIRDAITVEAWFHSEEGRSDAFQALVSKWSLRSAMEVFETYDAENTDGLDTRGFFGAVCNGRYIYFSPQSNSSGRHGEALRYDSYGAFTDPASWAGYSAGRTGGMNTRGYYGAVYDGRYVYYIPRRDNDGFHSRVLRYDTRGDFRSPESWSAFDVGHPISYQSGAFDGRYVYWVPGFDDYDQGNSGRVMRYDTQGAFDNAESYVLYDAGNTSGLGSKCYDGACFDGRYVYFAPLDGNENKGIALRLDTESDFSSPESWAAFDAKGSGLGMCVGAIFDGQYIYYVPYAHSVVVRYDSRGDFQDAGSWKAYDAADTSGLCTTGYDGAVFDGRYVYFIPFRYGKQQFATPHACLLRYDTEAGFTDPAGWDATDAGAHTSPPNPGGFNGGTFDGRYVYFAPWRLGTDENGGIISHGQVLRYDTTDSDASFILKYAECGHNGGLCAALPGPTFSVNTSEGVRNVRANRSPGPGWHHVAGVYDGARLTLYVDGIPVNEVEGTGCIQAGQADVGIGRIAGGGAQFKGRISEARISATARSGAWIQTTYRNLKAPHTFVRVGEEEREQERPHAQ